MGNLSYEIYVPGGSTRRQKEAESKDVSPALEDENEKKLPKEGSKPVCGQRWLRNKGHPKSRGFNRDSALGVRWWPEAIE